MFGCSRACLRCSPTPLPHIHATLTQNAPLNRGVLNDGATRHLSFDFYDDVSANKTARCTVLLLLRAWPHNFAPHKGHRARVLLSLDHPPTSSSYYRRGTAKLSRQNSTGVARVGFVPDRQRVYVAVVGPNRTKHDPPIRVNYTLRVRTACSPPLEEAVDLVPEVPVTSTLRGRVPMALFRLAGARAPSVTVRSLGAKSHILASSDIGIPPMPWGRDATAVQSAVSWRPYDIRCTRGDTYILLFLEGADAWEPGGGGLKTGVNSDDESSMPATPSAAKSRPRQPPRSSALSPDQRLRFEITASWDSAEARMAGGGAYQIRKVCGENYTHFFDAKQGQEWVAWVKMVPQSGIEAIGDMLNLMQAAATIGGLPMWHTGVFLRHASCPTQGRHNSAVFWADQLDGDSDMAEVTLSPPMHIGYQAGTWFVTIQPPPTSCYTYALALFSAGPEQQERRVTDGFRVGQKLEAVDFMGHFCVATVAAIDARFQRIYIHFDGWDDGGWDFWTAPNSSVIAYIGSTEAIGMPLDPPKGYLRDDNDEFEWERYLEETQSEAVPRSSFVQEEFFDMGMENLVDYDAMLREYEELDSD